jgi:predicted MFS family arabinose efflux permease
MNTAAAHDVAAGPGEFRRGWPIVLASLLGVGLGLSPLAFYTVGIFAPILAQKFGWSFGEIFAGITIQTVAVSLLAPVAGALSTRYGPRPVALISVVLFGFAFMAFALSNGSLVFYYAVWAAQAVLGVGTLPITWTRLINQRFERHKGLALGLALCGTGLFGTISKPMVGWFILHWGFRGAFVALGALPLLIAFPVAYVCFKEAPGLVRPVGEVPKVATGLTTVEALRHWRFWLIGLVLLPVSFAIAGPIPNMENILHVHGFVHGDIVRLTSLIGVSAIAGRLAGGWLLDLFWAPAVAVLILAMPCISCWLLSLDALGYSAAALSICLIGFSVGVEYDLLAYLTSRYFGLRSYATIYGFLYVFFGIGAGVGPMLFGWAFGASKSYTPILHVAFVSLALSALCLLALGRYPRFGVVDADGAWGAASA